MFYPHILPLFIICLLLGGSNCTGGANSTSSQGSISDQASISGKHPTVSCDQSSLMSISCMGGIKMADLQ